MTKKTGFNAQDLEHQEIIETQRQTLREVQIKNEQLEVCSSKICLKVFPFFFFPIMYI